jgi:hypothetical protein
VSEHQDARIEIDPTGDVRKQSLALPSSWCVALIEGESESPLQLVATRDLRAWVRRKLEEQIDEKPSKRVDYVPLMRAVRFWRVDSEIEADFVFLRESRSRFPPHRRPPMPERNAHLVVIDPADPHPHFLRIDATAARNPSHDSLATFGPFDEKSRADQWIESIEDAFDLCRYPRELRAAPAGRPCTYKQIGRCAAPCDGSVPMSWYRDRIRDAIRVLDDQDAEIQRIESHMKQLAADQRFEEAGALHARHKRLKIVAQHNPGRVTRCAFVTLQPGSRRGRSRLLLVDHASITEVVAIIDERISQEQFKAIQALLHTKSDQTSSDEGMGPHPNTISPDGEWLGILAHRVRREGPSRWTSPARLSVAWLREAYRQLSLPAKDQGVVSSVEPSTTLDSYSAQEGQV